MSNKKPNEVSQKQYNLSKDLMELFDKYIALLNLRNVYIEKKHGFKNAKRCAVQATTACREFWQAIHDLYPELQNKKLEYDEGKIKILWGKIKRKKNFGR